jgi:predicted NBD/HSP70 family sugar kinase
MKLLLWRKRGDLTTQQVLDEYYDQLARGLAAVINTLGSRCHSVRGEVLPILPISMNRFLCVWRNMFFGGECDTPIVPAIHGDSSGVRGAGLVEPLLNNFLSSLRMIRHPCEGRDLFADGCHWIPAFAGMTVGLC